MSTSSVLNKQVQKVVFKKSNNYKSNQKHTTNGLVAHAWPWDVAT